MCIEGGLYMKKIMAVATAMMLVTANVAGAADFLVKYDDYGMTISGECENVGENVNVTVWNENNELLYVEQKKLEDSTDFEFKVGVEKQNGLKIKVGGSDEYSPFMQFGERLKDYSTYYVSANGSSNGNGTKENPFNSLKTAYSKVSDGDLLYVVGSASWDIDATSEKAVTVSGGKVDFTQNGAVNIPLTIEDITVAGTTITAKNIVVGEKVKMSSAVSLQSDKAEIHSGNYSNVSGSVIRLFNGIDSIKATANAVVMEACEYSNITADYVIINGRGGNAEYKDGKIYVIPDDGRYVSVDNGEYKHKATIETKGNYRLKYDYDFKLHSAEVFHNQNGYNASIEISAYNRNNSDAKSTPILVAAAYDDSSVLQFVKSEEVKTGGTVKVDMELGKIDAENIRVDFYLWDSFGNMCPLTEMISGRDKVAEEELTYYVSPEGSDSGEGSFTDPFKTINKAIKIAESEDEPVVIKLKEGTHKVESDIAVSGENISIVGDNAVVSTGYEIPGSAFEKADQAFLDNLIEASVRDKIMAVSLKDLGITDYGKIYDYSTNTKDTVAPVLNQDNKRMELAMYPDSGYLKIGKTAEGGNGTDAMKLNVSGGIKRAASWKSSDIYADGYIHIEWRDSRAKVNISESNGDYIFTACDEKLGINPVSGQRVRFINVPEEITKPGEWYLDRDTGVLYVYPYEGFSENSVITFNPCRTNMNGVFALDGASNIAFSGITFKNIGTHAIDIKNSKNITIKECEFTDLLGDGVNMKESVDCIIKDNYLHHVSGGGFKISGGSTSNLIKANNYVTNNIMHDFSIDRRTYAPAVTTHGCGNVVSHNEIYNAPHMAIGIGGIDFIIEYNDIYNVCNETADAGAIYGAQYQYLRNNVIRYNYFHDITQNVDTGYAIVAVFFDDMWSAADVRSNIFHNVDLPVKINGGGYMEIKNNLMLDCKGGVVIDPIGERLYVGNMEKFRQTSTYKNLFYSPARSELWQKEFPDVYNMFDTVAEGTDSTAFNEITLTDDAFLPYGNKVIDNVYFATSFLNMQIADLGGAAKTLTTVSGNETKYLSKPKDWFIDYDAKYFGVKKDSGLYKSLPNFDAPEFDKIGVQR